VLLIGQSLDLSHPALLASIRGEEEGPLLDRVRQQVEAGADAIDLNAGLRAEVTDLEWCARVIRRAYPELPLFIDTATPLLIGEVLDACARMRVPQPLVANSLPVGDRGLFDADSTVALRVASRVGAGIVLSPRVADQRASSAVAQSQRIAIAAWFGVEAARTAGIRAPIYLDALAFPPLTDSVRCRRSLAVLRSARRMPDVTPLTAVGNVGYGAPAALASSLRAVYAAAATGAGALALILPVEDAATVRAVRLAEGVLEPETAADRWLVDVAAAASAGERPRSSPYVHAEAARLLFD